MTSRQCLFHQVTGCKKDKIDDACMQQCNKTATITNLKNEPFVIEKSKGNYPAIYNEINYLNTDIVHEIPNFFSGFLIDLRDVKTETKMDIDKLGLMDLFKNLLKGDTPKERLQIIYPTTDAPYKKGI
jgi:putative protease